MSDEELPGQPPRKKLKNELSSNTNTVRERNRRANMDQEKLAADKARKANNQAASRVRARLQGTPGFNDLPLHEREARINAEVSKLAAKRQLRAGTPTDFYKNSLEEARRYDPTAWEAEEFEETEEIAALNERFAQIEHRQHVQSFTKLSPTDDSKYVSTSLYDVHIRDWGLLRDWWTNTFRRFWEKLSILEGGSLTTGYKTIFQLMDFNLVSTIKPGFRPCIKTSKHVRRVVFNYKKKGYKQKKRRDLKPRDRAQRQVVMVHKPWEVCDAGEFGTRLRDPPRFSARQLTSKRFRQAALALIQRGQVLPHHIFSTAERAVFRNVITWDRALKPKNKDDSWVELPGPASLWPDDYDYARFGWEAEGDKEDAKSIYLFVAKNKNKSEAPSQFQGMLKSKVELRWKRGGEVDQFDL